MRSVALFSRAAAVVLLAACSQTVATSPAGWQPKPGASGQWTSGPQEYGLVQRPYQGTLQDYASTAAVNAVMQYHGAKFQGSDIFQPCPGRAAVATFALPGGKVLQEAFAVQNGQSVVVTYVRPNGTPADPAVATAMNNALCQLVM